MSNRVITTAESQSFCGPEIPGLDLLTELALNLRWSWDHATDELWRRLDEVTWKATNNPWLVLQTVPRIRLKAALEDASRFCRKREIPSRVLAGSPIHIPAPN